MATTTPRHYGALLETLKTYFPTPVSNAIMDGYFVHTVSCFLDRVDALKSAAPMLGHQREADYADHHTLTLNEISLTHLEETLRELYERDQTVAAIILTLGTTDAFGLDDLAAVVALRDRLVADYHLPFAPHLHTDAVIGWPWLVFKDYDFELNPLGFRARTFRSLQDSLERIQSLYLADSIGMDFHKTGYAPYTSSAFLTQRRDDLTLLSRDPAAMPYLYQFGHYHPGLFTLECSHSGAGALADLANLKLLGKQGYRVIIGHSVEMSEILREQLENLDGRRRGESGWAAGGGAGAAPCEQIESGGRPTPPYHRQQPRVCRPAPQPDRAPAGRPGRIPSRGGVGISPIWSARWPGCFSTST